ncbi:secondary thiamine-phosphate synthase enzyme YjbQ [Halanaeroarchaeum sulfurireducens]|uniref:Secondary thiamine-phosphate synthase enzyme n=1 Tax=Halanaeroarchaeum sulfurireducens TaxID=1604004 RepID=A0A0F7PAE1_9EURY|nr:secondary thiamine-phosphate synthase enzyme YjbQ [Halanaeroarchaeum sulfurireducens]AKH97682.1 hypothetical protein HLASF_1195 [Halanaeroarchaeum sulfurireducens]ALG82077.1 hypothetical protein HLASA_1183 [Halanaeroarchaeum sulfurireducens]
MSGSFTVETDHGVSVTDVTDLVTERVPDNVEDGICTVHVPHTTAGVTINEAESGLLADVETILSTLVSDDQAYRHDEIDDNATAHLRSMLLGSSVSVPITDGHLDLGTWQSILFFDGDGPRRRTVTVAIVGDS